MGTLSLTHTLVAGDIEDINKVQTNFTDIRTFLNNGNIGPENEEILPTCRVYRTTDQSIPNNTQTAITFDAERHDTDGLHSTVSNTGRVTITTAGVYQLTGSAHFAGNATGYRELAIRLNGATLITRARELSPTAAVGAALNVSTAYNLGAGDYVEMTVHQTSGGALNVLTLSNDSPEFSASWIARTS